MARKLQVEIVGDASSLAKSFRQASASSKSFGSSLGRVAKYSALAIGAAGVGGLAVVLKQGIAEFSEASKVSAQTGAVLKSTGNAANVTAGQVSSLAEALMRKSGVDDEAIQSGENMLLTFTRIRNEAGKGNDVFNQATKATLDLSVAMGKDMQSSAILVGKALNDPVKGMTALSRAGIQFTAEQKKAVEQMVKTGDTMGAQKMILKELETQFGGSAEAAGKTLPGQLSVLKQSLSNTAGEIVASLVPALQSILPAATTAITGALAAVSGFITKFSQAKGLEAKVRGVLDTAGDLAAKAVKVGQDIGAQIADALGRVNWTETGNKIAAGIGEAFRKGLPLLAQFAATITDGFNRAIADADWVTIGASIGQGIKDGVKRAAKKRVEEGLRDTLMDVAPTGTKMAIEVGRDAGNALADALGKETKKEVPLKMATVPIMIQQGADPAIARAVAAGNRIGAGLAGGLTAALSGVGASVANTILWQLNASEVQIKAKYGIHSPSLRWVEELGRPLGEGIVTGLDGGLALLYPKAQARIQAFEAKLKAQLQGARDRLGTAFAGLSDKLFRAFDAETSGHRTKAELEIDAINARRQAESLQKALADAMESGDPAAIARAQEDIQLAELERQAANERKAYEDQRATMRENLEKRLTLLGEHFKKEGTTVSLGLAAIQKLMTKFGISFQEAGEYIGKSFMFGLQQAVGGAAAAAGGVRGAQTGGNPRPPAPPMPPIVTQVVLDGKVIAETVRNENARYERANGALVPI